MAVQAKLGDDLAQLRKRFGDKFTIEGSERNSNLTYKFRSESYSVDVVLARSSGELVSTLEAYYSDKPLQANGEPPKAIVRGIMNVTAPKMKWLETKPVGVQRAAFITADGTCEAAILPPDKSACPDATFTVVVSRLTPLDLSSHTAEEQETPLPPPPPASSEKTPLVVDDVYTSESVTPASAPRVPVGINSGFVGALAGKSHKEIQVLLGKSPFLTQHDSYVYPAKIPGVFGEMDGFLLVYFAKRMDRASAFQLHTKCPLDNTFLRLTLQNAPASHFEPLYQPSNLTGQNWVDKQNGFGASTCQESETEFLFTIDMTPAKERTSSPFYQKPKDQ